MKENLYHKKNVVLMEMLIEMVPYLCKSFELQVSMIEDECKYLRELYIKLFLVIEAPDLKNCVMLYELVIENDGAYMMRE
jgi:hypothetical protein